MCSKVKSLQSLSQSEVKNIITEVIKSLFSSFRTDQNLGRKQLQTTINTLKNKLFHETSWDLHLAICNDILDAINDLTFDSRDILEIEVVLGLSELIVHSKTTKIDFNQVPQVITDNLYNNLHNMKNLEILNMGIQPNRVDASYMEGLMVNALKNMNNLLELSFNRYCSNNVLTALVKYCRKLVYLNVNHSSRISDDSIDLLVQCKTLVKVMLKCTNVSLSGYADLLCRHPTLRNIGECDKMVQILEHLDEMKYQQTLNLTHFWSRNILFKHLNLIKNYYPLLKSLIINCKILNGDMSSLGNLKYLEELTFVDANFSEHGIQNLLQNIGGKIIKLHLLSVEEFDFNALISVGMFCPNLESLIMDKCSVKQNSLINYAKWKCLFKDVKHLECGDNTPKEHIKFLLTTCKNVEFLSFANCENLTDKDMQSILEINPMNRLACLNIVKNKKLTLKTVNLFIQKCHNLKRFYEIEMFDTISKEELYKFKQTYPTLISKIQPSTYLKRRYDLPY